MTTGLPGGLLSLYFLGGKSNSHALQDLKEAGRLDYLFGFAFKQLPVEAIIFGLLAVCY